MGDVISIFRNKKDIMLNNPQINQNNEILKDGLLLLGENLKKVFFPFSRIGLEIFNKTSLWFFVNIQDLGKESFLSVNAFNELGRMCIFIPDLSLVSLDTQKVIFESLLLFGEDSPKIISVIHSPIKDLIEQGLVLPYLVNQLKKVSINSHELKEVDSQSVEEIVAHIRKQIILN